MAGAARSRLRSSGQSERVPRRPRKGDKLPADKTDLRRLALVQGDDIAPTEQDRVSIAAGTIAYWTLLAGIYLGFGFLWYYAAKEKLIDDSGTMPAGLAKAYAGSFADSFPGLNLTWTLLGIAEAVAFLGFVASILTGEFLPSRRKPILLGALGVSLLTIGPADLRPGDDRRNRRRRQPLRLLRRDRGHGPPRHPAAAPQGHLASAAGRERRVGRLKS